MTSLFSWLGQSIGLGTRFRKFWATLSGAGGSHEIMTPEKTLSMSPWWRGVRLYAETCGTLPLNIYEILDGGESRIVRGENPYDLVLRVSPNEDLTPCEFWEAIIAAMMFTGNGYARKHRAGGRLIGLELINATPFRDSNNRLRYRGNDAVGRPFDIPASEMFHLKGFSFGGDEGLSVVQFAALSSSTAYSALKTSGRLMSSGLASAGILEASQTFEDGDRERLQTIVDSYAASENPAKVMIIEGGMKFNRTGFSAADAQLIEQGNFGVEEVGRWLGIPTILLGHASDGQTMWGTGVEAIVGTWYTLGLRAVLTRTEKAITKRIFEPADRVKFFPKFNVDGLLRGDSAAQAALFSAAAQNGWLTRNEIRKLLDLPPMPGGDALTVQVNLTLLKDLGSINPQVATQARNALLTWLGEGGSRKAAG